MKTFKTFLKIVLVSLIGLVGSQMMAKDISNDRHGFDFLLVGGLTQPIFLHGGNVEVDFLTDNWVFEYSHGFALNFSKYPDFTLTPAERDQGLRVFAPFSTGGGIGYRITKGLNIRAEFKVHKYEVTNRDGETIDYVVRDLGIGAYYFWFPFQHERFVVVPSIRWWPMIGNSLNEGKHTFSNGDVHEAKQSGLIINVSLGVRI